MIYTKLFESLPEFLNSLFARKEFVTELKEEAVHASGERIHFNVEVD